jgi:hypothetical protein
VRIKLADPCEGAQEVPNIISISIHIHNFKKAGGVAQVVKYKKKKISPY